MTATIRITEKNIGYLTFDNEEEAREWMNEEGDFDGVKWNASEASYELLADSASPVQTGFTIESVKARLTFIYEPESYLEYCKECDEAPTNDGFLDFLQSDIEEDFNGNEVDMTIYHQQSS